MTTAEGLDPPLAEVSITSDGEVATLGGGRLEDRKVGSVHLARRSLMLFTDELYTHYLHGIDEATEDVVGASLANIDSLNLCLKCRRPDHDRCRETCDEEMKYVDCEDVYSATIEDDIPSTGLLDRVSVQMKQSTSDAFTETRLKSALISNGKKQSDITTNCDKLYDKSENGADDEMSGHCSGLHVGDRLQRTTRLSLTIRVVPKVLKTKLFLSRKF